MLMRRSSGRALVAAAFLALLPGCAENPAAGTMSSSIFGEGAIFGGDPLPGGPAGPDAPVHEASQVSFGEPQVVPAGFNGPQAVADTDGPYLLDTGDRLRVFVYGQPNLSRGYTVDHDGTISIPLIGSVTARGKTVKDLAAGIRSKLGLVIRAQILPVLRLARLEHDGVNTFVRNRIETRAIADAPETGAGNPALPCHLIGRQLVDKAKPNFRWTSL